MEQYIEAALDALLAYKSLIITALGEFMSTEGLRTEARETL